jgi:hypothetical protein
MKGHRSAELNLEAKGLAFGAGAISESPELNHPKRKTIHIKLPRKPAAPRSSAVVKYHWARPVPD